MENEECMDRHIAVVVAWGSVLARDPENVSFDLQSQAWSAKFWRMLKRMTK
jgi:hypothetical protein